MECVILLGTMRTGLERQGRSLGFCFLRVRPAKQNLALPSPPFWFVSYSTPCAWKTLSFLAKMSLGLRPSLHGEVLNIRAFPSNLCHQLTGSEESLFPSSSTDFYCNSISTKPLALMLIHSVNNSFEIYIRLLLIYLQCICRVYYINQGNDRTLSHQQRIENPPSLNK